MSRYFPLLVLALLFSCTAPRTAGTYDTAGIGGDVRVVESNSVQDLTDYLRTISGVQVSGNGPTANVTIRGAASFELTSEPLFVLDGVILGNGISTAYDVVTIPEIDYIRVLKRPEDLAMYGSRGANGVVEITMRRNTAE